VNWELKIDLAIVNAKPPLRALADVTLRWMDDAITIRRCAVFEKPGAPPWANLPRLPVEKHGSRIYVPLIELPQDLKQRVLDALLDEYRKRSNAPVTTSPGVSGPQSGRCPGLTTRDSVRQETPGAPLPGLEVKATEKLSTGRGRRRRPT
jgi:hypothetical protein